MSRYSVIYKSHGGVGQVVKPSGLISRQLWTGFEGSTPSASAPIPYSIMGELPIEGPLRRAIFRVKLKSHDGLPKYAWKPLPENSDTSKRKMVRSRSWYGF
jgi:hypothetical protein